MPLTAAALARVSTKQQTNEDRVSLDAQVRLIKAYAVQAGMLLAEEHIILEQYSGLKVERPTTNQIVTLLREHKIQALIVFNSDRYTRNNIFGSLFDAELRRANCELHYVSRGKVDIYSPSGRLMNSVERAFSEYEAHVIMERTQRAKRELTQQGIPLTQGYAKFGYIRTGTRKNAQLIIDESVRFIIENIFSWYASGVSVRSIIERLRGIPTASDRYSHDGTHGKQNSYGVWNISAVYNILKDEIYCGVYYANKTKYVDSVRVYTAKDEWTPVAVPAMVSRELWEQCQHRLVTSRSREPKKHTIYEFLLARLSKCQCGLSMRSIRAFGGSNRNKELFYYACLSTQQPTVKGKCGLKHFRRDVVEQKVWAKICELMADPNSLKAGIDAKDSQQEKALQAHELRRIDIQLEIEQHTKALQNIAYNLSLSTDTLAAMLRQQAQVHNDQIKELEKELKRITLKPVLNMDAFSEFTNHAGLISPALDIADFQFKRWIIETMDFTFTFEQKGTTQIVHIWIIGIDNPVIIKE